MLTTASVLKGRNSHRQRSVQVRLSLEEEIMSLDSLIPGVLSQLSSFFAESVTDVASKVLGEETGEALIRCIGDSKLKNPAAVYSSLDEFFGGGSEDVKQVIRQAFTRKVHNLYRISLEVASRQRPH